MKILHLISQRPDSTGSGIYLQAIMGHAALAGHENYLVAGVQEGEMGSLDVGDDDKVSFLIFESAEFPGKILGMSDIMPYPSRKFRDLSIKEVQTYLAGYEKLLRQAVQRHRPDVIHSQHLWLLSSLARTLFPDIPVIASCHGSDLRQFNQCPHLRAQVLAGCRRLDAILALSESQRDEIASGYGISKDRIMVTGAGYNDTIFYPPAETVGSDRYDIVYGGKLSRAKGVPWLLQGLKDLAHLDYHLHIAGGGTGKEYQDCLDLCTVLGDKVTLHGVLSQLQLADLMRSSNLFVLPSLHEGLPLVVLEALACGCKVLATDLPGVREIHRHLVHHKLSLIPAPRVIDLDSSDLENPGQFVRDIESSLGELISAPRQTPDSGSLPDYFSWRQVFKRVENIWVKTFATANKLRK